MTEAPARRTKAVLRRLSGIGASAQAAIPGFYAWAITVAPAAWSRGAPAVAKVVAVMGVLALGAAPLLENASRASAPPGPSQGAFGALRRVSGAALARAVSVWGFVLSSAIVWVLVPHALSAKHLDAVRGALGVVGWALFAFASAGPALRASPDSEGRIVASTSLKPRSELPRGDALYVAVGAALALVLSVIGWGVASPERAVLVRLVVVVAGIAVISATTTVALARHAARVPASRALRLRRALPWLVLLALFLGSALVVALAR